MKALGPGVRMLVDVSQKLDLLDSIRQAKVPAQFDLVWYEEPVNPEDDNACACPIVANAGNIPHNADRTCVEPARAQLMTSHNAHPSPRHRCESPRIGPEATQPTLPPPATRNSSASWLPSLMSSTTGIET